MDEWRELLDRHATVSCALEKSLQGEHGIGVSEFETLDRLVDANCGSYRMADVAQDIHLSQSALSRAVARLEKDGLVRRSMCEDDRRGVSVCLTDKATGCTTPRSPRTGRCCSARGIPPSADGPGLTAEGGTGEDRSRVARDGAHELARPGDRAYPRRVRRSPPVRVLDSLVIGAGQAGLSSSYHLARRSLDHVVLDANDAPGGAWQHRWDSLSMDDVHGVADLPDAPAPGSSGDRANAVVPAWFAAYERDHDLPVLRPAPVDEVTSEDDLLVVRAGERSWRTRTLVNATGTWTRPFVPRYPGQETFAGEQLHPVDHPGAGHFAGRRVLVVGGGASAVQLLGELAPVTDTLWVTRREPVWIDHFDPEDGRAAVARVEERVRRGLPPQSVVSVTGLALRPQEAEAERLGAYRRLPMFARIEPDGVRWADGRFEPVDVILWATGFRPAVGHLAPLRLRSEHGGIRLDGTTAVADPRVQLVGYGPSASTIGANRAGRAAATAIARRLRSAAA